MRQSLTLNTFLILVLVAFASNAQESATQKSDADKQYLLTYPNLKNPGGEVLLENEHVVVQRFVVGPGEWEGIHTHPGNQVYVHIKGGLWSGRADRKTIYTGPAVEDGSVGWMERIPLSEGHESGNVGDTPIELIWVTLKGDAPIRPDFEHRPQYYPKIPLELLLDNDRVIVQRVQVKPSEWEGIHSHPGNQVYIHIKGGVWTARSGGIQAGPFPFSESGSVGWMKAIEFSEGHESGNTGDTTIDLVWITIK